MYVVFNYFEMEMGQGLQFRKNQILSDIFFEQDMNYQNKTHL